MPALEKQVRVFISSTFRDMHAARDNLVTVVFPELRPPSPRLRQRLRTGRARLRRAGERVEQLGLEFFDVDRGKRMKAEG